MIATKQTLAISLPLPEALAGIAGGRRLIKTLAWLSPTNWASRRYHLVKLTPSVVDNPLDPNKRMKRATPNHLSSRRGTVAHEVHTTNSAVPLLDPTLRLRIDRSNRGTFTEPIPFGLALTLEVDPALGIPVYQQVRIALRTQTGNQIRVQTSPTAI